MLSRKQKMDTTLVFTVLFNLVAIVEMMLLGESGFRAADGNFGWGMMGASLMLWIVCMIRFLKNEDMKQWFKPKKLIAWTLLAWHLVSGVYYYGYLLTSGTTI